MSFLYNDLDQKPSPNHLIKTQVLPKFFVALLIAFLGMVIGAQFLPKSIAVCMPLVVLLLLIIALFVKRGRSKENKYKKSSDGFSVSMRFVYFLSFLLGVGMYPTISYHVSETGAKLVFLGLGITALLFGLLAIYAYKTKEDFSNMGVFLFFSLLTLIILSIVGLFVHLTIFHLLLSFAGILIFSGYILYDISCMKQADFTEEDVPMAVLNLLLDFLNILSDILDLLSIVKN